MIEVLEKPEHKVANVAFVVLNLLAALWMLMAIVLTTVWLTSTDVFLPGEIQPPAFLRLNVAGLIFLGCANSSLMLFTLAQIIRYLAISVDSLTRLSSSSFNSSTKVSAQNPEAGRRWSSDMPD